jgi:ribonuclease-3
MEFLGDSILGSVVASYIYKRFYEIYGQHEGVLTQLKIRIVCGENLTRLSKDLKLQEHLVISKYQEGRDNSKMLEDILEAFIGAIYLDTDYQTAEDFIIKVIEKYVDFTEILMNDNNYKDQISRYFQKVYNVYPKYVHSSSNDTFYCKLYHGETYIIQGSGLSKKKSEQDASRKALIHFNVLT